MTKKQVTIALLSILIIASFFRLYNLMPMDNTGSFSPPGLYPDEAMNGNNVVEAMANDNLKIFYPENFGREGLFINIQGLFIKALGNTPWALRLPSALFGIVTVLGLYFLARELYASEPLALFSAFLLATSFWHVNFSRIGFRAIMAPAFLTWGVYFFLKTLKKTAVDARKEEWKSRIGNWLLPVFGGLVYGLGFHSYIAYRVTPLLMLAIAYLFFRNSRIGNHRFPAKAFFIFTAVAIIVALPLGIYFLQHPADFFGRTVGISVFNSPAPLRDLALNIIKTLGMFNVAGDFNWRQNFAGRPELSFMVGIFFLFGIYLSVKKIVKEKSAAIPEEILLSWFVIVMLPVVISDEGIPHALRSILLIPPAIIFAAVGGMRAYELLKPRFTPAGLCAIVSAFCLMLIVETYVLYFVLWTNRPETHDAFAYQDYLIAEQINTLPNKLKKYVLVSDAKGVIRRDYPISLQSILFLTDTFSAEKRAEKNISYLTADEFKSLRIPAGSIVISR